MKTTSRTSRILPSPIRFSIYIIAVAAFCFVNWTALKAADPADDEAPSLEARLAEALVPVADPEPELEDWMLIVPENYNTVVAESEIILENWMLTFADEYVAANTESEIRLESWMLTVTESEIALESWMVDRAEFQDSEDTEIELTVEEWMVTSSTWINTVILAKK
jgi:hypothetical protein